MRVLYVSQYFVRGDQPGGVRHWYHTQAMRDAGFDVHVVTTYVLHKERTVPAAYRGKKIVRETEDGMTMWRTYSTPGYGRDLRSRISNYASYAFWATVAAFRAPRPDVVLASSPSLPAAAGAALVALVRRVPFVFEVRDLWPESAIEMGLVRAGSPFARIAAALERFCCRRAAHVIALTDGVRDGAIRKGARPDRVTVVTNGVDHLPAPAEPADAPVPADAFVAMYVGIIGTYSALDTILNAAWLLRGRDDIRFVLVGAGDQKPRLEQRARELKLANLVFVDSVPKSAVPSWLARADACLISYQNTKLFAGALPNKIFDYMGAAKPVVAAVPDGELTRVLAAAKCGISVPAEDAAAVAGAVATLADHRDQGPLLGQAGFRYVSEHFDRTRLAATVVDIVTRAARGA